VVAISEHTKSEIIRFYGIDPNKIKVNYQACDASFKVIKTITERAAIIRKYKLPEKYFLYVGSIIERKNLLTLVKAIEKLPEPFRFPLVVVGEGRQYKKAVKRYIEQEGIDHLIIFTEKISFEDLPSIYQASQIFIYPSFAEGFGIPIIEALSSQVPVITSNTSCLPEAGGPSSLLVNPHKAEEITQAIVEICSNDSLRSKMVEDGVEYVKKFDGERVTRELYDAYQELLNS
jgi:glycosyltransferase involved in cell wall biosynthesis